MDEIQKTTLAIIPVRMSSQRLPGKPLAEIAGQTLVERVWRQACKAERLTKVCIATDSEEIAEVVHEFGGETVMTSSDISTGSQRVAAASKLVAGDWDLVANVQGDMPFIRPELIDETIDFFVGQKWDCSMATAATPIFSKEAFQAASDVKVVISFQGTALYFSRAPIPHSRDGDWPSYRDSSGELRRVYGYKHFGLYIFKPEVLFEYETDQLSPLEEIEKLEQLRLLEKGHKIAACIVDPQLTEGSLEVDTPKDLEEAREIAGLPQ